MTESPPIGELLAEALKPLPCPFCGEDVERASFWFGCHAKAGGYHVFCLECPVDGPHRDTLDEAISAWNCRSLPGRREGETSRNQPSDRRADALSVGLDAEPSAAWRPIETAPKDGTLRLFWSPLGGPFIAPDIEVEAPPRHEVVKMIQSGADWPDVGWNPTHWMPLPEAPR